MRRTVTAALALLTLAAAAPAAAAALNVSLNQGTRLPLRGEAADVVISNPAIADVVMIDSRTVLVMGKRYGVTNLVVFDGARRVLFDGAVTVTSPHTGEVAVFRGSTQTSYACAARCEASPSTGGGASASAEAAAPAGNQ